MKTFTVEQTLNGYVLRIQDNTYVYVDEVELLEMIKEYLDLGEDIEVKRKQ